ncbi:MAG: family 16 glycosylhydrolase [Acidobacteriaceae bacterium]|nr:family 16 glycosylhydrolase [Acidobacteriaceae bacterium]
MEFFSRIKTRGFFTAGILMCMAAAHPAAAQNWQLIWSDEFNGAAGSFPDSTKWMYDTGGGGWGNDELEIYCSPGSNRAPCSAANPNVFMDGNGNLVIRARKDSEGNWTSARLNTQGLFSFQYGRVEARIKLTVGNGLWPTLWMLGNNIDSVGWPQCGEDDILEWVDSYGPNTTDSASHGPGYSGGNPILATYTFPNGGRIDDSGYHIYGLIWSPDLLQYYRDSPSNIFLTITPSSIPPGDQWVFNAPFFIILNLAVGGNWFPGPDSTTPNPADMLVDYVRVYQDVVGPIAPRNLVATPVSSTQINLSWTASTTPGVTYTVLRGGTAVATGIGGTTYSDTGLSPSTTYSYTVEAVSSSATSSPSNTATVTTQAGPCTNCADVIAINSGGSAAGNFGPDAYYSGGTAASTTAAISTTGVPNPAPQAVYQSERYGDFTYTIPGLHAGSNYNVRLHFAEFYWTSTAQRIFNVSINGTSVLSNFDIIAAAGGANKAIVEQFTATADSSGQITIQFTTVKDDAKISGIEVQQASTNVAINAGGNAEGSFGADEDYTGGKSFSTTATISTTGVTNPAPQAVYQTERFGNFTYTIPGFTAGSTHTVRLHFAEIYWTSAGQRIFNVSINGTTVLSNFDIIAAAGGPNKAIVEQFTEPANSSGQYVIHFTTVTDNSKLSGLEIQ